MEKTNQTHTDNTSSAPRTSEDWTRMEDELAEWGRKLDEMRLKADRVGQDVVDDLQRRYDAVKREAETLQQRTEEEIEQARREAEAFKAKAEEQSESTTAAVRERTGKVKQSAHDLGEGFTKAWNELRSGFQQAYERLN